MNSPDLSTLPDAELRLSADDADLADLCGNPRVHVQPAIVAIPTTEHSCRAGCIVTIARGEPCVSMTIRKPTGGFTIYFHIGCAPDWIPVKPLRQDRALRYISKTFAKKKRATDIPKAAWCVLTAILVEANS